VKYAAIADWATAKQYSVTFMCTQLGVVRQGYYRWLAEGPCQRERTDAELTEQIRDIHAELHAPDLIGQDFTAEQPDTRWCGDITYSAQPAVMCSPDGGVRAAGSLAMVRLHIIRGLAGRRAGGRQDGIVAMVGGGRRVGVVPLLWR